MISQDAILVAAAAGLAVTMLVMGVARALATPRVRIHGRLAELADANPYQRDASLLRTSRVSKLPFIDALVHWRGGIEETRLLLERAGVPLLVGEYRALRAVAAGGGLVAGLVAGATAGTPAITWLGAGVGLFAGFAFLPFYVKFRVRKRKARIESQIVEFCEVMASMLKSGFGYLQALGATAEQIEEPMSGYLQSFTDAIELGGDVDEELERLNQRLDSQDFDMVATAIAIQRRTGGNLAELLERVAETVRQRQEFHREVLALTSEERFSAVILAAFPLVLGLGFMAILPETYLVLFTDPRGRMVLAAMLVMDLIGYLAVQRMIKVEV